MPVVTSSPGVYVEELPSGVRTITGVATSVTAFVGRTLRGAVGEPIRCASWADFERRCGGLWADSELGYAVYQFFLNGGAQAVVSRIQVGASTSGTTVAGTAGEALGLESASPGSWGAALRVTVDYGIPGSVSETADTDTFHLTIEEVDPAVEVTAEYDKAVLLRESFPHVSVDPDSPRYVEVVVAQGSSLARVTPPLPPGRPVAVSHQPFTGGGDGLTTDADDVQFEDAIDLLGQADVVNLLCIPPLDRNTPTTLATWQYALAWCESHRAVLLVDPPAAWGEVQDAADLAGGFEQLRSPNSAFYYPRILSADPRQQNLARPFVPSGAVAGVMARTDAERGVWKAPAGTEAVLAGVTGLDVQVTDDDSGNLNPRGVNALRDLSVVGPVVWGARTGRGADVLSSEWKYLPVRRLALFIEESLSRGTQWAVFEPNDAPLWSQMRLAVGTFMHDLFRQGAFQGSTPRDAYLVRCDATTTTQADVDLGIVNVLVGFAPLKPAEFVMLKFQQIAGQAAA
jgi:phage tail sheath protein FI